MDASTLTDRTLEETLARAAQLILGVNSNPVTRTVLASRGLTAAEIVRGLGMVDGILAIEVPSTEPVLTPESQAAKGAMTTVDSRDERTLRETGAILSNGHEGARDYLVSGLEPKEGVESALVFQTWCRRYLALRDGTAEGREDTREADSAAIARLSERGYGDAFVEEMQGLVDTAFAPTPTPTPAVASAADVTAILADRREKLVALKKWYDEWATTARIHLTKKSQLIALGLASRKKPKAEQAVAAKA